jgi:hypothetical protein
MTQANILKKLAFWNSFSYESLRGKTEGFNQEDWLLEKTDFFWSIYIPGSKGTDKYKEIRWFSDISNFELSNKNEEVIKTPEKKITLLNQMVQHLDSSMTNPQFLFDKIVSKKPPTLEQTLSTMSLQTFVPYQKLKEKAEELNKGDWLLVKGFWDWKIFFPSSDDGI